MKSEEFDRIRALEDVHWWYKGRKHLLERLKETIKLRNALILDAGCGTGFAGRLLAECGTVIGLDASRHAFDESVSAEINCLALIDKTPFSDNTFDLVVGMDLIEHLDDDQSALNEMYRVCKEGGYLFITAPAYRWMWSAHDESLEHKQRYSLNEVISKIRKSGFDIEKSSYFVSTVFLAAFIYRMLRRKSAASSDLAPVAKPINTVLTSIMKTEASIAWRIGLPFGMTAFVLARKPEKDPVE
ncbi:MAG: class I SAM-dependent methyltransferase [Armatimonadota bacterium]